MPRFIIPVWWSLQCDMEVEANSLEEAINNVECQEVEWPTDEDGEYIDDSFTVNMEVARELNDLTESV